MEDIINYLGCGGTVLLLLAVFIEITPIKINPIEWLGKRLNASMKKEIDEIKKDLNVHIAQDYRNKILEFQNECLHGIGHTKEQFDEVLNACADYEKYCKDNDIANGKCAQAIKYIERVYSKRCAEKDFIDLKTK